MKQKSMREKLTAGYLFLLFTCYPLIVHDGYTDLLTVKTYFFYALTFGYFALMLIASLPSLFCRADRKRLRVSSARLRGTECFALLFCGSALLSFLHSGQKADLWYGNYGRNFGLLALLCCAVMCVCVFCNFRYHRFVFFGAMAAGAAVMGIAVCNYLGWDVLSMYGGAGYPKESVFISTMGNLNVFAAYAGLLLSFEMALFVSCRERASKRVYGVFCFLGFCAMPASNSDGIYLTAGAAFLLLALLFRELETGRFVWLLLAEFASAGILMGLLAEARRGHGMRLGGICGRMSDIRIHLFLLAISALASACLGWLAKKETARAERIWRTCRKLAAGGIFAAAALLLLASACLSAALPPEQAEELLGGWYPYLYFGSRWGSGRGEIWRAALLIFERMSPWEKCFGYGVSGFYFAAEAYLKDAAELIHTSRGVMTDAHNAYLQYLVTIGAAGAASFAGLLLCLAREFWKRSKEEAANAAFLTLLTAFAVQAAVNNVHIYIEPVAAAFLAAGLAICRKG